MFFFFSVFPLLAGSALATTTITVTHTVTAYVTAPAAEHPSSLSSAVVPEQYSTTVKTTVTSCVSAVSQAAPSNNNPVVSPIPSSVMSMRSSAAAVEAPTAGATFNPKPPPSKHVNKSPKEFTDLHELVKAAQEGSGGAFDDAGSWGTTVINSCSYSVYLSTVGCGPSTPREEIASGKTHTSPLRICPDTAPGGVQLQFVAQAHAPPGNATLVEYTANNTQSVLYYNLSFLRCMVPHATDLSSCVGWKEGIQVGSGEGCDIWACLPGNYCDTYAYTVDEYGYGIGAPVSGCGYAQGGKGIAVELCAGNGADRG